MDGARVIWWLVERSSGEPPATRELMAGEGSYGWATRQPAPFVQEEGSGITFGTCQDFHKKSLALVACSRF